MSIVITKHRRVETVPLLGSSSPLVFVGVRVPHTPGLLAGGSARSEPESFLDVLSDGHRAQDVEEDETAVCHVVPQQVPVAQS